MLMKIYQVVFFFTLSAGTAIACSTNSWFTCWLGLEINLMSLIPLLINKLTPLSTETAIKYFLAQAMASLMIIFASLTDSMTTSINMMEINNEIILVALCIKAGMAPFHFWFPQVMKIADWAQCTMILTWQKIAPFILISSISSSSTAIFISAASAVIGSLGGLNQMTMKNILTYSSIAHSAWMLAICFSGHIMHWMTYFLIYTLISVSLIIMLYKTNINSVNQMLTLNWTNFLKMSFMVSLMSLGGLPPFLGFMAKLSAAQLIISMMSSMLLMILIGASLVSLYYYSRVMYSLLMKTSMMNIVQTNNQTSNHKMVSSLAIAGNLMAPTLVLLT